MEFRDFEKELKRLEKIVAELEKGELALEKALKLFEEGIKISRLCGEKLEEAEQKVEILVKDSQGEFKEKPLREIENSHEAGE